MPGVFRCPRMGHHRTGVELSVALERPGESLNDILDGVLFDAAERYCEPRRNGGFGYAC